MDNQYHSWYLLVAGRCFR